MKRIFTPGVLTPIACVLVLTSGAVGWTLHRSYGNEPILAPARAATPAEERVLAALREMSETGKTHLAVPESDGRRLRLFAEAVDARNVVELGTSTGYSTFWLCVGVKGVDGHVTTFEADEERAAAASENFRRAGAAGRTTVVVGDAHDRVSRLKGPIDLIFLDADKQGYADYLEKLLPLVRPGGLILAHNVDDAPQYMRSVGADRRLETLRLTQGSGLTVTLKKR